MRLVLGIGNPGARYARTRHNVGFRVLDALAAARGWAFRKVSSLRMEATGGDGGRLVKPLTYVNRSGAALEEALATGETSLEGLLVVVDDVNLPVGRLRLRPSGSHGGHNGLKDLERCLGGNGFARLRIGVGAAPGGGGELREHVLGEFDAGEEAAVDAVVAVVARAASEFLGGASIEALMTRYNGAVAGPGRAALPSETDARERD